MRPPASILSIFFAATLMLAASVSAQEQTFQTQQRGGGQDFAYNYRTADGHTQALSFRLNLDDIARGSSEFKAWDDFAARSYAIGEVQKRARQISTAALSIEVRPAPNGMVIRTVGVDPTPRNPQVKAAEKTLNETYTTTLQSYASRSMYTTVPKEGVTYIRPDYAAIAVRYTPAMGPVAQAILQQVPGAAQSPRNFINAALAWLQTIPYDTLDDRTTSNGAGFQTPYGLMLGNLGDCDTKATALAALIHAAYPGIPLAIVTVPEHAFLAVGLPQTNEDYALRTEQGTFILADATGPGRTPLGMIDERTRGRIQPDRTELLPIR